MKLTKEAQRLIENCIRGGSDAYYWILDRKTQQKRTAWFSSKILVDPPNYGDGKDLYFCLCPTKGIPQHKNERGETMPKESTRPYITDISAVSCLWADCDDKNGWTADKVQALQPAPSVVVSTGGGWQAYWILDKAYQVDDSNREMMGGYFRGWVNYIGGDPAANDLARIGRVPGSMNYKYDPPREVSIITPDTGTRYQLLQLLSYLPEEAPQEGGKPVPAGTVINGDVGSIETSARNLVNIALARWIHEEGGRNKAGYKLASQLRDLRISEQEAQKYLLEYQAACPRGNHEYTEREALDSLKSAYRGTPREAPQGERFTQDRVQNTPPAPKTTKNAVLAPQEALQESPQGKPRFIIRTAKDALQPQPPIEYIIDKLLTAGSVAVFYGEPGAKKTYCLVSMAVCVAAGLPWVNFRTYKAPVLIIDEESGESRLARRLSEALRGEGCGEETPIFSISLAGFKLDSTSDPAIIQTVIETTGAKLVILDALADVMTGDENSKEDTQPVLTELRKIADKTGSAIVLIHHSNKMGGYRGSSAIKGAVDLMVKVESEDGKNIVMFESEKNRDGDRQQWAAVATWNNLEETFTLRSWTAQSKKFTAAQRHVIEFLTEKGPSTVNEIINAASICSPQMARQAIYPLANMGEIERVNEGEREARYAIVRPVRPVNDL